MLLDGLLSQLAPFECLGCSAEGKLICDDCSPALTAQPDYCYRCRRLTMAGKTCQACRHHTELFAVRPAYVYEGLAKEMVWQLKFQGAQAAAAEMASHMAKRLGSSANLLIVPVPTATSRARQRGYDQAKLIAKALAQRTGLPYRDVLRRSGQHHQVGSNRAQRRSQLAQAYRCARSAAVTGKHVLLVDDVLTTGATLEVAAKVIKAAGAQRVSATVFVQA